MFGIPVPTIVVGMEPENPFLERKHHFSWVLASTFQRQFHLRPLGRVIPDWTNILLMVQKSQGSPTTVWMVLKPCK